jgi:hypothetical protein
MVARGKRHHAVSALLRRHRREGVERTSRFEGTEALQALWLDEGARLKRCIEGVMAQQRGVDHEGRYAALCGEDVL